MTHGQPVTLADMHGWGDPNHWLGKWAKGFGKDVIDVDEIVGNWIHYVVDTLSETAGAGNTLREALTSPTEYWITFDPSLGVGTITLTSDLRFRENKFIDGTGVRITIASDNTLSTSSSYVLSNSDDSNKKGRFGAYNIIFANGGAGDGINLADGYATTGRAYWLWAFCEFHGSNPILDDTIDTSGRPTLGHYTTQVGCWFGPNSGTTNWGRCQVFGNNRDDQFNHHGRLTILRCAYYGSTTARINFRTPLATDWHVEDIETYRECGTRTVIVRNNNVANVRRVIFRSRYSVWDIAKSAAGNDHIAHDGGSSSATAYVRVDNQYETNGTSALPQGTLNLGEHDPGTVTNSFIYVDESGNNLAYYNDYTPGLDFTGMNGPAVRLFLRGFAKWQDHITVGGTLNGSAGQDIAGKTITLTTTVDNWPTLSLGQKGSIVAGLRGGNAWSEVVTAMAIGLVRDPNIVTAVGKTVTITIPNDIDVFFPTAESIDVWLPNTVFTRSAYIGGDSEIVIDATTPPGELHALPLMRNPLVRRFLARAGW